MRAKKKSSRPRRTVPPFSKAKHEITHAQARRMRKRFIGLFGEKSDFASPKAYSRNIFDKILSQKECVGIRFYPAIDDDGKVTMLYCGVDAKGNDILAGYIGDVPFWCPPYCSDANGILQF